MQTRQRIIIGAVALSLALLLLRRSGEPARRTTLSGSDDSGAPRENAPWWSALHEQYVQEVAAADEEKVGSRALRDPSQPPLSAGQPA